MHRFGPDQGLGQRRGSTQGSGLGRAMGSGIGSGSGKDSWRSQGQVDMDAVLEDHTALAEDDSGWIWHWTGSGYKQGSESRRGGEQGRNSDLRTASGTQTRTWSRSGRGRGARSGRGHGAGGGLAAVMDLDIGPNAREDGSLEVDTALHACLRSGQEVPQEGRGAQLSEQRLMGGI